MHSLSAGLKVATRPAAGERGTSLRKAARDRALAAA